MTAVSIQQPKAADFKARKAFGARGNKFRAVATTVDGIRFLSKAEAHRYTMLRLLQMQGTISQLETQPRYDLTLNGVDCGFAKMDFRYVETASGREIVEDVKGKDNALSTLKRKLVWALYGIDVRVVSASGALIAKKGRPAKQRRTAKKPAT